MNLILTGLRGTGKTTIGQLLAQKLNRPFLDLDTEIEKQHGQKIADIVKKHGWNYFRDLEHAMVKNILTVQNHVISTGGGTLIFDRNYNLLKINSFIILLKGDLAEIAKRMAHGQNRPPLTSHKNSIDELEAVWKERKEKYYKIADFVIDTSKKGVEQIAEEIIKELLKKHDFNSINPVQ